MEAATSTLTSVYRHATLEDIGEIAAIEAATFDEPYLHRMLRQLFELNHSTWFVAEVAGSVVGYALTIERDNVAWLVTFAVKPLSQGRGHGRALLSETLAQCRARSFDALYLTVCPNNPSAYNLFKSVGFTYFGSDGTYFGIDEPRDILVFHTTPKTGGHP